MQALVLALTLATICKRERASFCQLPYPIHASHNVPLLDAAIRARYDSLAVLSTNTNCLRALRYLFTRGYSARRLVYETLKERYQNQYAAPPG